MRIMELDNKRKLLSEGEYQRLKQSIFEKEQYRDCIRGCMLGGAVGDALGWPVEFKSEREIFNKYWPDGIKTYQLNSSGKAEITDDTQMALFTANGILQGKTENQIRGINTPLRQYVALAYQDWLYTQEEGHETKLFPGGISWLNNVKGLFHRRAPGGTCLRALRLQNSAPGKIPDCINAEPNESKGCGDIMRIAPMELMNWHNTPEVKNIIRFHNSMWLYEGWQ